MMKIGEFAQATSLSVKALRHYDETGLLVPAETDPVTGYRLYAEEQVRDGAVICQLRRAGVPLAQVRAAVDSGDPVAVLRAYEQQLVAERAVQDAAIAASHTMLDCFARPVPVSERRCPPLPYAGRIIRVASEAEAEALDDDVASTGFEELYRELTAAVHTPTGAMWTGMREGPRASLEVLLCWAVEQPLPAGWGGDRTEVGQLPERTELVAEWDLSEPIDLPEDTMHPAALALFDAIAARGLQVTEQAVRQQVRYDLDPPVLELSLPVSA
ncbi:MerR family transcriptional regulator [Brevibacterium luteolum]|uniref:MerR family transcriptional regulator n=1 Tax=Brevibacterium luteolum TaxID=199591 RepID=UPI0021B017DD|nr:MerR family transcriptional regulator [Brevibacterium luteolum]MCT1829951.1 MerR family transcriptional regulator [Brevibacterium luteolum]